MRILRLLFPIKLENLLNSRIRIERINSIKLKSDPTITLNKTITKNSLSLYTKIFTKTIELSCNYIIKIKIKKINNNLESILISNIDLH